MEMVDRYGQSTNGVVDRWMWMQMGLVGVWTGDRQEMGSRPRQTEVDGLVSDGWMESGWSWWIGGQICVGQMDGQIGCDINRN